MSRKSDEKQARISAELTSTGGYKIAVLDFGKTNKKIAIFTQGLDLEHRESTRIGEVSIDDFLSDNIEETMSWALEKMKEVAGRSDIKAISAATCGATVALIDEFGKLVFPVISYNQEPGEDIKRKFFDTFGSPEELYRKTGTPQYGQLLNVGIQLFWLKERYPKRFSRVKHILFLPQYIGFLLTGKIAVDPTTVGAHTYMYDFDAKDWSSVVEGLGIKDKLPPVLSKPWDVLGEVKEDVRREVGLKEGCRVVVGIHDSNASLLPYLLTEKGFILASTGTWCVFMRPGVRFSVSEEDLHRDTLYYLDPFGQPVKSSRFKGGEEHDHYASLIRGRFGKGSLCMEADAEVLNEIVSSAGCFVVPALTQGSGPFPCSKPRIIGEEIFYKSIESAYHALNLSLAIQSSICIRRLSAKKTKVFIEGGFSNNRVYMSMLATILSESRILVSKVKEGTSLGAAICAKCGLEMIDPTGIEKSVIRMEKEPVKGLDVDRALLDEYIDKFEGICDSGDKNDKE